MICLGFASSQDLMANEVNYIELGLSCADVCRALDRGDEREAIEGAQSACARCNRAVEYVGPN